MRRDPLPVLGLAVALVLVTSPLWFLPHAGDVTTTYGAERIEYETGTDGWIRAGGPIRGLDCYRDELTRGCLFAERIVAEGPITVDTSEPVLSAAQFTDAPFVAVGSDPAFRRRNVGSAGTDSGAVRYALDPVGPATVLRGVAREPSDVPPPIRSVLDGGTVTVHGRAYDLTGVVVRSEGAYVRLHVVSRSEPTWDRNHGLVIVVRAVPFLIGLAFLLSRRPGGTVVGRDDGP